MAKQDEILRARQTNLAEFLLSKGIELERVGRRFKSKSHDSLVFTDNAYFWNSIQDKGNAVDYLIKHMGYEFADAVNELSQFSGTSQTVRKKEFRIADIELAENVHRAFAYLNKTRGIDSDIIQDLIKNKMLFQSKEKGNIIFPIWNEKNEIVGAELNGTLSDSRFKGISEGSLYGYGFNIRTSEIKDLKNYMFFESTIDMLSYINLQKKAGNIKNYRNTIFISMGGLKLNIIQRTLQAFKGIDDPNIFLAIDKDAAAKNFSELVCKELKDCKIASSISSIYPDSNNFSIIPEEKDWNDDLKKNKFFTSKT